MAKVRISIPPVANAGDTIEIKTLISHPMETGFRRGLDGKKIPRNILKSFQCRYDKKTVFSATFFPAVAANPYLTFFIKATQTGNVSFIWVDQAGKETQESHRLTVTDKT